MWLSVLGTETAGCSCNVGVAVPVSTVVPMSTVFKGSCAHREQYS